MANEDFSYLRDGLREEKWFFREQDVKSILEYNPETGAFTWKVDRPNRKAGSPAGHWKKDTGYLEICLYGRRVYAHRIAIWYATGEIPPKVVDHINRDRSDNRLVNLRSVDQSVNQHNRNLISLTTKTGHVGVTQYKDGKFRAEITVREKRIPLGVFNSKEEAVAAYKTAKRLLRVGFIEQ